MTSSHLDAILDQFTRHLAYPIAVLVAPNPA